MELARSLDCRRGAGADSIRTAGQRERAEVCGLSGEVRRGRGRPRVAAESGVVVSTRLTPSEVDALYRLARARRVEMSDLIRRTLRQLLKHVGGGLTQTLAPALARKQLENIDARLAVLESWKDAQERVV